MARLIAKIAGALLLEAERVLLWTVIILILPLALLALLFAGPIVIWERVPIASPSQVQIYVDAAREASESTKSPCDPGVKIEWQPLLAIEAARLNPDFRKATPARARELARSVHRAKWNISGMHGQGPAHLTELPYLQVEGPRRGPK
ncbi:hypothetical protein [Thermanaeromonas sp. C210]|uniref:hypothetical protein n=1 Tax=Thermanaeromonas sp. C210 TaxID=2731925 RepID=UPI00155B8E7A|nr:hypothetical protein [Thermanaeromonas sp. C210]GFN21961.1 hypothetical protein TAMC210_02770 [Thermanaeromonas sp. C210]